jgi:hypothetical protein
MGENKIIGQFNWPVRAAFGLCLCYWLVLFFNTSMAILFDAQNYQQLGLDIFEKGWGHYFRTGPHREPLYPATIAFSYWMEDAWGFNYQSVQKGVQLLCLFFTQVLVLVMARLWGLRKGLQPVLIVLIGFSPALVNAAFSLFSEILVLPATAALCLVMYGFAEAVRRRCVKCVIAQSLMLSVVFVAVTLTKAIFEYVFYLFMAILAAGIAGALFRKSWTLFKNVVPGFLILAIVTGGLLSGYKSLNRAFNGEYKITTRGADLFFGNAYKRTEPFSFTLLLSHLASVPGEGFCRKFFSDETCQHAGFLGADFSRGAPLQATLEGYAENEGITKDQFVYRVAFSRIKDRPVQYVTLAVFEAIKMFFWESTKVGFVNYPGPLERLYNTKIFSELLRGAVGLLTLIAFIYQGIFLVRAFRKFGVQAFERPEIILSLCLFFVISAYTLLYSMFSVVARYALVLGPLYILCVLKWVDAVLQMRGLRHEK